MRFGLLLLFLCLPLTSHAAVIINEVAWMGTDASTDDEWIELHNTGPESVVLDDWIVEIWEIPAEAEPSLSIALTGTLPSDGYGVLERTDDTSAAGSALLTYTGALINSGGTLKLYKYDSSIEDQIAGGEDWENIGGDNVTKETAQYTSSGWVTAAATPGSANASYQAPPTDDVSEEEVTEDTQDEDSDTESTTKKSSKNNKATELKLPDVALSLVVDAPDIVAVNQPVSFTVTPSGIGESLLDSLTYTWNFGDLSTTHTQEPSHTFLHPGEYVVTVHASYARHEQIARKRITVLPVTFSITRALSGDMQLHNTAHYEVAVADYVVRVNNQEIVFPENSILLPNATLTIAKERLGGSFTHAQLFDQQGVLVATYYKHRAVPELSVPVQQQQAAAIQVVSAKPAKREGNFVFQERTDIQEPQEDTQTSTTDTVETLSADTTTVTQGTASPAVPKEAVPVLGLLGIMTLGILGVYFGRVKS